MKTSAQKLADIQQKHRLTKEAISDVAQLLIEQSNVHQAELNKLSLGILETFNQPNKQYFEED